MERRFNVLHHDDRGRLIQCATTDDYGLRNLLGREEPGADYETLREPMHEGDRVTLTIAPVRLPVEFAEVEPAISGAVTVTLPTQPGQPNHWELLGIEAPPHNADFDGDEERSRIKKAFRTKLGESHPENGGANDKHAILSWARDTALRELGISVE